MTTIDKPALAMEENLSSLFQLDTLLPTQYFETFRRKTHLDPERKLMLMVLEDAVSRFQKHLFARERKAKALFRDAEGWILEDNSDWLFSFENVCEVLGFNPGYVRQGLLRWKQKKAKNRRVAKIYRLPVRPEGNEAGLKLSRRTQEGLQKAAGR